MLRLALANLHRPGAATSSVTVSLGLGLAVLIAVCQYRHHLYWAITFSVCVAYATGLSGLVQRVTEKVRSLLKS